MDMDLIQLYVNAILPNLSLKQRKDAAMSPFYARLNGLDLPPALFTVGTEDLLFEDSVMIALRQEMSGLKATLKIFPGEAHAFQLFSHYNSTKVKMQICEFLKGLLNTI